MRKIGLVLLALLVAGGNLHFLLADVQQTGPARTGGGVSLGGSNAFIGTNSFRGPVTFDRATGGGTTISLTGGSSGTVQSLIGLSASSDGVTFGAATNTNILSIFTGAVIANASTCFGWGSSGTNSWVTLDASLCRNEAAAAIQMGADANGTAVSQQFTGPDGITGTDRIAGGLAVGPGRGTGAGAGEQFTILRPLQLTTGTTRQSYSHGAAYCESKTLSNTSATTTALANITVPSNSSGSVKLTVAVHCTDGTNFDSTVMTSMQAYVNKAGTITFGTQTDQTAPAANNSGSCTIAPTYTASGNSVNVNVTPVITTIVPTTTTAYVNIENLGTGLVTCQ